MDWFLIMLVRDLRLVLVVEMTERVLWCRGDVYEDDCFEQSQDSAGRGEGFSVAIAGWGSDRVWLGE